MYSFRDDNVTDVLRFENNLSSTVSAFDYEYRCSLMHLLLLVIAREHPSCAAPLQLPYLVREGSSKCLNTGMKTIYHAASSYLSFLLFTRIESRAVK